MTAPSRVTSGTCPTPSLCDNRNTCLGACKFVHMPADERYEEWNELASPDAPPSLLRLTALWLRVRIAAWWRS